MGISYLPSIYTAIIKLAVQNYTDTNFTGKKFNQKDLNKFAKYMLANIIE